jgi:cephalosporin hydroxylase
MFMATVCQLVGNGRIITIDINDYEGRPQHTLINYIKGSSIAAETHEQLRSAIRPHERVMVVLDADHSANFVRQELAVFAPLVSPGCYLIVEDTNIGGNPVPSADPGPMAAVERFLASNSDFEADRDRERFLMTLNPKGYLRRRDGDSVPSSS